jgi:hypothetical protein
MLLRLCQLKSPYIGLITLTLFLSSCSWRRDEGPTSTELLTTFNNHWFSHNKNHSIVDTQNEPEPHLLFDTTPEFKVQERTVNIVLATPQGSAHAYSIDLNSGQRYYSHTYCKQKDIWNKYSGTINRPVFSIGYMPRVLDQLGEAQKVIVFSKRGSFLDTALTNYHKIKLVGAYVEQICPDGNCLGKNNWLSKLVFIGVDAEDGGLASMMTTADFKKSFDWETSKSYLENIDGKNFIGDLNYPATRVGQLIEYEDAFDYFKKRSIFLSDVELKKIQKGCHILYDRLWEEVGMERPEDKPAKDMKEMNAKIKLREQIKKEKKPVGFAARFQKFTKKYYTEVSTCEKFVYHGNVNIDREKFWFLSYVGLFYRLHREGYFFDCRNRTWQRNVLNDQGEPVYSLKRDIDGCKELEIDQAMDYLPNFLKGLKGEKDYFRFVDYDNHPFGTHKKMYSWVKVKSQRFDCSGDPNVAVKREMDLFPEDVAWKEKNVKDYADREKIIY